MPLTTTNLNRALAHARHLIETRQVNPANIALHECHGSEEWCDLRNEYADRIHGIQDDVQRTLVTEDLMALMLLAMHGNIHAVD